MLCLAHIDQPGVSEKRNPTRFLINAFCAALVMCLLLFVSGCGSLLFSSGYPRYEGTVRALPLESPVKVVRDSWGIPHIYAENNLDLMAAQGFVHAQDRLWQMELFRRLTQGRVAEIAGEAAVMSDYFVKLIGFPTLTKRAAAEVSAEDRRMVQAYVDGVNASLALQQKQKKLPIEFKLLGLTPEPWTVEDAFGVLAAVSWFFQANYTSEILAVKARTKLSRSDWDLLFPSHPGAVFPGDEYFESIRTLRIAPFHKAAVAFYDSFFGSSSNGGSNSWAVARSRDGMPLLANDTHMTLMVPNIWYVCHLDSPDMHVAGFSIAGSPGIFIGHNEHIAWGFTNLVLDAQDLFVLETDPRNPMRYRVGDRWLTMEEERVTVGLPHGRERVMTGYRTVFGPVITELTKEAEAVVALKWYGSLDQEELKDKSTHGFFELAKAASVEEAINAG
ncbi:MAG TPA: penicillin acylase family protein, partial [Spirochaetia bacterium]|nr:penicillin acylase family protein [Spirochaetia bacterium]